MGCVLPKAVYRGRNQDGLKARIGLDLLVTVYTDRSNYGSLLVLLQSAQESYQEAYEYKTAES